MGSSSVLPSGPVVVCGAGAAGIAAAISAARTHANVVLVEARPEIGGTVAHALIHTLGGLYDSRGQTLNAGLSDELERRLTQSDARAKRRQMGRLWVLSVCPRVYARVVRDWVSEYPNIQVRCGTHVSRAWTRDDYVTALELCNRAGSDQIEPAAVVDATGGAEVVRLIDSELVEDDPERAAGAWIFTLREVSPDALQFPKGLGFLRAIRAAAQAGTLPRECEKAWLDSGVSNNEVYVKLFVPLRDGWRQTNPRSRADAQLTQAAVVDFLRSTPEFAHARVDQTGELGVRDGGRIRGEYCLTADDVLAGRKFPDAACRCSWPIEYWHPEQGVSLTYLENDLYYEIPLEALKLKGYRNVWAAGKCLSADRLCMLRPVWSGRAGQWEKPPVVRQRDKGLIVMLNVDDLFRKRVERQPEHPAVLGPGLSRITYAALDEMVESVASALGRAGVGPGACVGVHVPSGIDSIVLTYAVWRRGGCVVPIPVELAEDEKVEICRTIAVDFVVAAPHMPSFVEPHRGGDEVQLPRSAVLVALRSSRRHPPAFSEINAAFIRFTSGTTGTSKGVVLSHESIRERIDAANEALEIGPDDRVVWVLSMSYHFTVSIVAYLTFGATIVLPKNHLAAELLESILREKATLLYASPMHYTWLADSPKATPLTTLRLAISTAMSLDREAARKFGERYGVPVAQALGIIEVGLSAINFDFAAERPEAVGRILPAFRLQLADVGLGPGIGEVLLSGKGFLDAYYEPWRTRDEIMHDGWFHTGDIGELDANGCLIIRGRSKDVINTMGMKFFPREVEEVLESHPLVREACVFPRANLRFGEIPCARVVVDSAAPLDVDELIGLCRGRLADYKVPHSIQIVDRLERTPSGKLLRLAEPLRQTSRVG